MRKCVSKHFKVDKQKKYYSLLALVIFSDIISFHNLRLKKKNVIGTLIIVLRIVVFIYVFLI